MTDDLIERLRGDLPYKKVESHWITDYTAVEIQNREAADRIEALEAALRKILEGTIPRPVGEQYFPDRVSKNDRCVHNVWMYETCGNCIDDFIKAALEPSN